MHFRRILAGMKEPFEFLNYEVETSDCTGAVNVTALRCGGFRLESYMSSLSV